VAVVDGADTLADDVAADFLRRQLLERRGDGFHRTVDVALDDDLELVELAGLDLIVKLIERDVALLAHLAILGGHAAALGHFAGFAFVADDDEGVAGLRRAFHAQDLHGGRRAGFVAGLAALVEDGAHLAGPDAGDEYVADA